MAALTQRSLIVAVTATAVVIVVLGYFVYSMRSPCDSIFEQTTARLEGKLKLIKSADADVLIGREKVQDLTESAQKIALNLKACCVVCGGKLNGGEFLQCKSSGDQQDERLARLAEILKAAQVAKQQDKPNAVSQKVAEAGRLADDVGAGTVKLEKQVSVLAAAAPAQPESVSVGGSEQEPNNDIFHPNIIKFGSAISGEISPADDQDWFRFRADTPVRDRVDIKIDNRSTALKPCVAVFDDNRSQMSDGACASNASANIQLVRSLDAGKDYYVRVTSDWGTVGAYVLSVTAQKAYDAYEPNNDIFSAKQISVGRPIDANIMDKTEADWFFLKGFPGKQVLVRAENRSTTLKPCITVFDSNRSQVGDRACASNPSANVELSRSVEAGKDYFIRITSDWGTDGDYHLTVDEGGK